MSFLISDHNNSKRVRVIKLNESDLDKIVFPFKKHSILSAILLSILNNFLNRVIDSHSAFIFNGNNYLLINRGK